MSHTPDYAAIPGPSSDLGEELWNDLFDLGHRSTMPLVFRGSRR